MFCGFFQTNSKLKLQLKYLKFCKTDSIIKRANLKLWIKDNKRYEEKPTGKNDRR